MHRVRTPACASLTVLLFTLVTTPGAAAQIAFAPSAKLVGEVAGRGVAVADFNGDRLPDVFVAGFARDAAWNLSARPLEVWLNASRRASSLR